MGWTLGIDTSSTILSLGLLKDGNRELSFTRYINNSHAEHIATVVKSFIDISGINVSDISHCGVVVGPGSFTGLRIGIAFIKGLFITGDTKITAISALENVANSITSTTQNIKVAFDGRQDNVFVGEYILNSGIIKPICDDYKIDKESFYNSIKDNETIAFDTMGFKNSNVFDDLNSNNIVDLSKVSLARGISAAEIAFLRIEDETLWSESVNIFPEYMQESYAERVKKQ